MIIFLAMQPGACEPGGTRRVFETAASLVQQF